MREDGDGVLGDEPRSPVDVHGRHRAVSAEALVETSLEEGRGLGGADHEVQHEAGGVVEEDQHDAPESPDSGAKVLSVAQHHVEAVREGEAAGVAILGPATPDDRKLQTKAGPVDRAAIDGLTGTQDSPLPSPSDELGDRRILIPGLLRAQELEEVRG